MKFPSFKWIVLIVLLFTILYVNNRYEIFALNIPNGEGMEKPEGSFRVVTYNVNDHRDEDPEIVKKEILEVIESLGPDILCFQELTYHVFKQLRGSLDSIFGYSNSLNIKNEPLRYWVYSRRPIRNFHRINCIIGNDTKGFDSIQINEIETIKSKMPVYSAEIEVEPSRWITVFSVHLRSSAYSTARRSMKDGSSWWDGFTLYLDNYIVGKKIRNFEADNLRLYLDSLESKDTPIIIAGDFNDWSGSYCLNTIRDDKYNDAWWEGGFGFGTTYDEWHLKLRLDHILFNHHFNLVSTFVQKSPFSDHYPLIVDFVLK